MLHAPGVLEVLRIAPLFRGVPQDLLAKNLSQTKVRHLKPGEILLVPGKANKVMYIILAGRLNIQTKEANVEPIAVLGEANPPTREDLFLH